MHTIDSLRAWLRSTFARYTYAGRGILTLGPQALGTVIDGGTPDQLVAELSRKKMLLPLPKEPAALANVLEVGLVDYLEVKLFPHQESVTMTRGSERGYPDIELHFQDQTLGPVAVDIKVAQRARTRSRTRTQSRITLYTGNTYFKWPDLHWPGTLRPFSEYSAHLDIILIYTLREDLPERVSDVEVVVQEPWTIASRKRSSTTREYIGAVDLIEDLRQGHGEFRTEADFYRYWRSYPFRLSAGVQNQLQRLTNQQSEEIARLRASNT